MYFAEDINYGGARYIPTGRGFSFTTSSFIRLFTFYGRSHLYPGFELLFMALMLLAFMDCRGCSYLSLTWGAWACGWWWLRSSFIGWSAGWLVEHPRQQPTSSRGVHGQLSSRHRLGLSWLFG